MLTKFEIESQGRSRAPFCPGRFMHPDGNGVRAYAASCGASDTAAGPALQTLTFPVTRA